MIFYDMFVTHYKASHLVSLYEKISVNLMKGVVQWSSIKETFLYTLSSISPYIYELLGKG